MAAGEVHLVGDIYFTVPDVPESTMKRPYTWLVTERGEAEQCA